jgi:hypothetical protein
MRHTESRKVGLKPGHLTRESHIVHFVEILQNMLYKYFTFYIPAFNKIVRIVLKLVRNCINEVYDGIR